jgi:hypothetical protein
MVKRGESMREGRSDNLRELILWCRAAQKPAAAAM